MATVHPETPAEPPSDTPVSTSSPSSTSPTHSPHRLSLPFDRRLLLASFASFSCGTFLGYLNTSRMAALRFRAENAHRLPSTQPGWYLYHKSKSYYKFQQGIPAALRSGAYLSLWTGIFFVIEESMDVFRGTWRAGRTFSEMEGVSELEVNRMDKEIECSRDYLSSTIAGMVTGGLWSATNKFPMVTAARTIRIGLLAGLGYGVTQDALTWARGKTGGIVNDAESWIYRGAKNRQKKEEQEQPQQEE
ncbi:hypothetical protein DM02DRAFT_619266 [Periconia macrospinosa]|uniref:Tim17-domain-containing protein n=1 Tax=Periconia macrospinosa TaxID=97972 RepID=A0A2V1D5V2_9PLEO|nr:hypothetical protein DM02DRAFT_619266 [Periconia macrospinosa]